MQVRAKGAQFLMLQIADGQNAAIANYLLPQRLVWPSRLGQGDNPAATIQKIDDYWLQLTLTGTLSAERAQSAYIGIQLRDNSNRGAFRPNGQAVTIRAVQLERGETATPYREFSLSQHPG
jgi:hypothetical protein